jgi:cytochrome P450
MIRGKMVELEQSQSLDNEDVKGGLLSYLLARKELSFDEIVANVTELMLAGVDTVRINYLVLVVVVLLKLTNEITVYS